MLDLVLNILHALYVFLISLWSGYDSYPHHTDETSEAQRAQGTYLRLYNREESEIGSNTNLTHLKNL